MSPALTRCMTRPVIGPLRLAVVTETFPPEVNGVALTLSRLVAGLRERGHTVELVRPDQGERDVGTPGLEEHRVSSLPIPRYPQLRLGLPAAGRLRRLWTAQRPDLVHVVTEGPLGASAVRAARRLGLPVVSDFRTNFHAYTGHYGVGWLAAPMEAWLRRLHNRTDRTFVPTARLAAELGARGFERLRVIGRGVDAQRFDPAHRCPALRASWGADEHTLVALCVGRLAPEKNLDTVIDAWRAMQQVRPGTRLVLVGDGPEAARLRARCPQAVFTGPLRGEALARAYASADVFLFASLTETFGNVVPEAMASGLAVVAYDHAAAATLISPARDGLIAPSGDRGAFLRLAVHAAGDLPGAQRLGRHARATAQALDWSRIVAALEAEYAAVLAEAAVPRPTEGAAAAA